jgi:hypothetical protein
MSTAPPLDQVIVRLFARKPNGQLANTNIRLYVPVSSAAERVTYDGLTYVFVQLTPQYVNAIQDDPTKVWLDYWQELPPIDLTLGVTPATPTTAPPTEEPPASISELESQ